MIFVASLSSCEDTRTILIGVPLNCTLATGGVARLYRGAEPEPGGGSAGHRACVPHGADLRRVRVPHGGEEHRGGAYSETAGETEPGAGPDCRRRAGAGHAR